MTTLKIRKTTGNKLSIQHGVVELAHGSGGRAMQQLIDQLFIKAYGNPWLASKEDQALLILNSKRIVMTTDSHVVTPLFFPGGDIGKLAVNGTINDLAMAGAKPLYLSVGFILEEGFQLSLLQAIVASMAEAAKQAGVAIVTGDTKVVERGKADGVFINTTGIGELADNIKLSHKIKPHDKIIVSGYIGDHGIAVLSQRPHLQFSTEVVSDCAPLHQLVASTLHAVPNISCLRDPTRGGVAATLNEWAHQHGCGIILDEANIPIRESVLAACELLGIDPLYVANEGKCLLVCPQESAEQVIMTMKSHPLGQHAAVIGEVVASCEPYVEMRTVFGGRRMVDWLSAEQLPRIC